VLPAVAEVVLVPDPVPGLHQVPEPESRLIEALELVIRAHGAVLTVAYPERVQVRLLPAHHGLDHRVHPVEGVRRWDEHPPPHWRVRDVLERDPDLQQGIARLRHAPNAADRVLAEAGELGGVGFPVEHYRRDHVRKTRYRNVFRT
jgi:hypothetical protein